jgi:hypothetical protein
LLLEAELGDHLRVAAEDDVRAATGHVGGDGDRALAAGLRDDVRLVLVVLGVEHACLIFFFSRKRAIAVLFSTLVVPTRMGCPFSCFSRISAMRAVNFSFSVL